MRIARRLGAWPFVDVENNVRGIRRSKSLKRGFYGRRWASTRREWCVDNQRSTRQLRFVEPVSDGEPYSLVIERVADFGLGYRLDSSVLDPANNGSFPNDKQDNFRVGLVRAVFDL